MDPSPPTASARRISSALLDRCGELGAWCLDVFIAFPRFAWREIFRPAWCEHRHRRVLADETLRLFYLQGVAPLMTRRSAFIMLVSLLAIVVAGNAAIYGAHATVEGFAAKLVVLTLVPGFAAFNVVLGSQARWYSTLERARARGEASTWAQWGASLWLMQGAPQIAAAALAGALLSVVNLVTLLCAEPLLSAIQRFAMPHALPLDLSLEVTPWLFLLAIAKAMTLCAGLTAWYAFSAAKAGRPVFDTLVVRATQPFVFAWMAVEAMSWWLG